MITARDIRQVTFEKILHGYRCEDVENFLKQVADTQDALAAQVTELEAKAQALTLQLDEYRSNEEAAQQLTVKAKQISDEIIRQAKLEAESITAEAETNLKVQQKQAAQQQREAELQLEKLQQQAAQFKEQLLLLYKQHIALINRMPGVQVEESAFSAVEGEIPPFAAETRQAPALQIMRDGLQNAPRRSVKTVLYDQDNDGFDG